MYRSTPYYSYNVRTRTLIKAYKPLDVGVYAAATCNRTRSLVRFASVISISNL
jgi:hypothetical protein